MLTIEQIQKLTTIVKNSIKKRGKDFYAWRNSPEINDGKFFKSTGWGDYKKSVEINPNEAFDIFKEKLDGVYGERFVLSMAVAIAAVKKGKEVALLQTHEEDTPFDPEGWIELGIEGHRIFHIDPRDLPTQELFDSGLITVIQADSEEANKWKWKNTTKVDEFCFILDLLLE